MVATEPGGETENLERFFTPERLAQIDSAIGQIDAGSCLTASRPDVELANRRTEWLKSNPG